MLSTLCFLCQKTIPFAFIAAMGLVAALPLAGQEKAPDEQAPEKIAYMGVIAGEVTVPLAKHLELPEGFGLQVEHVVAESPADLAGVKRHDVLLKLDDQKLTTQRHLATLVRSYQPEKEVALTLLRKGEKLTLTVALGEQPEAVREALERYRKQQQEWMKVVEAAGLKSSEKGSGIEIGPELAARLPFTAGMVKIDNQQGEVVIIEGNGEHSIHIKNESGETVYEGTYDCEKGSKGLPLEARDHLKRMKIEDLKLLIPTRPAIKPPIEKDLTPQPKPEEKEAKEVL